MAGHSLEIRGSLEVLPLVPAPLENVTRDLMVLKKAWPVGRLFAVYCDQVQIWRLTKRML
ncbi:hypothetical protein XM38_021920 [Halomicronema hongdechloris C2206]|uniref:Uncharacterized protein n=1 Tax=Halomicronema hongdechloris C2206 TaxID=1641165 RepID=A0A1Z3HLS3_9CYAN|nr:hypothetical protein XM38_021920 [Halomicronema hongdechloris C2206]